MTAAVAILIALDAVSPRMLTDEAMRLDVAAFGGPTLTLSELERELRNLEAQGLVVGITDRLTKTVKWKITMKGCGEVAERRNG
jgi:hypothetical protein